MLSISFVEDAFNRFNDLCFGGKLPPVQISLVKAHTFLGKMEYRTRHTLLGSSIVSYRMKISSSFDLPDEELEDVVIHEMIHYYIAYNHLRDTSTHGRLFREMMERINSDYGRHLTIRHKCAPDTPVRHHPSHWVCVSQFEDGRYGVTVCSERMAERLRGRLKRYFRLHNTVWYQSTDPFWDRFPRARTPKIYRITLQEIQEHLEAAGVASGTE